MGCRNIPPMEQILRVLVAVFLVAYTIIMKPSVVMGAALTFVGIVLIYTAFVEYCPIKEWLGISRCKAVSVAGQTTKGKRREEKEAKKTRATTKGRKTAKKATKATKRTKATATKRTTKAARKTKTKKATKKRGRKK